MNVTLTLDETLVKKIRKIAVDRDTSLAAMVRAYLQSVAEESEREEKKRRDIERFLRSVDELSTPLGEVTWTREELHARPGRRG
jgi:predicted transcriptional regulator